MTELEARRHINDLVASGRITPRDRVALLGLRYELHRRRQSRLVRFLRAVVYVFAHEPDDRRA
jgi:hypothetical protein